jgi:hypothetical protein
MAMKRFLILFIVIVFVTVSCAGPTKVGWTKPDFHQEAFEKDRGECKRSIDKNLVSEAFGKALEECLVGKGYKYHRTEVKHSQVKYSNLTTAETILLCIVLIPVGTAFLILSAGGGIGGGGFGGLGR